MLFEADRSDAVAIYLHGNGNTSVFSSVRETNATAEALTKEGIAYFPFDNRGAHLLNKLNVVMSNGRIERRRYGCAYELISECVHDIDGAIKYLQELGYTTFYLIGASTGANKIWVYNHYKPDNAVSKYVLLGGGDDLGSGYHELGKEAFQDILHSAKTAVQEQQGEQPAASALTKTYGIPFTQQSAWDTLNPDGDYNIFPFNEYLNDLRLSTKPLFGYFSEITKPYLAVYGAEDEYCYGDVPKIIEILKHHANPVADAQFEIVEGADHGFTDHEDDVASMMAKFLAG